MGAKKNPAAAAKEPHAKKAMACAPAPPAVLPPASGLLHPTLEFLHCDVLDVLQPELMHLKSQKAEAFAGISAFDRAAYRREMGSCGAYECNVVLTAHKLLTFEHASIYPAKGSIIRLSKSLFWDVSAEQFKPSWPYTITVRGLSATEAPPDGFERLHYSAYLFAYLYAWAQAKRTGLTDVVDAFAEVGKRCRTRFLLLPDEDEANRSKWSLQEKADSVSENAAAMVGYKRTVGVVEVSSNLRLRNLPCDAQAVANWFNTINFNNAEDAISKKIVQLYTRVHGRLTALPEICERLDQTESHFNRKHVFAGIAFLDQLCGKTGLPQNPSLQGQLLLWCVEGMLVMMLRKDIKPDVGRETAVSKLVPKLLLLRRIITWLANRFRYSANPGTTYREKYDPGTVMKTLFGSWSSYHKAFPKGRPLDAEDTTEVGATPDMTFITKLPDSLQQLIDFCCALMDCRSDVDAILSAAVGMDPMMSAEAFFERRRDLVSEEIFDIKSFVEACVIRKLCTTVCVIQEPDINTPISVFMYFVRLSGV